MDLYGHHIKLNFDQEGSIHKTLLGGYFSLIVRLLLLLYVLRLLKRLLLSEEAVHSTHTAKMDWTQEVYFNTTSLLLINHLSKQLGGNLSYLR